jgi:polygalacturonase
MHDYDITFFGGKGDGQTDNSNAFAAAFAALRTAGGGALRVGKGVWRTGPLELFSRTTLSLDEGAVVSFIPEVDRHRPVYTRWEGVECFGLHPLIFASGQEHVAITGTGTCDGSGAFWWQRVRDRRAAGQKTPATLQEWELARLNPGYDDQPSGGGGRSTQFLRPPFVQFYKCADVLIEGITLTNSPFWTLHPLFCENVTIRGITITNPYDAPNTDGMDIDSCSNVLIENCHVTVGDDGICLKSGSGADGLRANKPTRDVLVRDCAVQNGHGGIVIGSETAGGVFNVTAENCVFTGTDRGIRIKTRRGRGGHIRDLIFRNLIMENNLCPLAINMFYRCGASLADGFFSPNALQINDATPTIKNITVSGIRATGCKASAGFIAGIPEAPIENLVINDSEFSTDEKSQMSPMDSDMFLGLPEVREKSFRVLNAINARFEKVTVTGPATGFIYR